MLHCKLQTLAHKQPGAYQVQVIFAVCYSGLRLMLRGPVKSTPREVLCPVKLTALYRQAMYWKLGDLHNGTASTGL